ncbi:MAG: hypothetical protein O4965_05900 [Trichodesmium sp. St19_bin1]|nr:hypothetical protein [Trichodesmium sp. St19_bin1]
MATLLQSIDPGLIADEGVRQTVEVLLIGLTQYRYIWCQKLSFSRYCHYT